MNKIITIIIATFALVNTTYSQSDEQFKATSGLTTEVGFTPFASEGPVIYLNNLNVRWFFKPEYALRLGLTANYDSQIQDQEIGLAPASVTYKGFGIRLNPGIEKHFAGTDRLSPYIGAELTFQSSTSKYLIEYDTISQIVNLNEEIIYGKSDERKQNRFIAGVGLFAGTDFYISKNLYMGVEFSYSFQNVFPSSYTRKIDGKEVDQYTWESSGFSLSSSTEGVIRLGWKF